MVPYADRRLLTCPSYQNCLRSAPTDESPGA